MSARSRLLSSRQRARYSAKQRQKVEDAKAEKRREAQIHSIMSSVEATMRLDSTAGSSGVNRVAQQQQGFKALEKITTLFDKDRKRAQRRNMKKRQQQHLDPIGPDMAATYPPGKPTRPAAQQFRARTMNQRHKRFRDPLAQSLSPQRAPHSPIWDVESNPLAPVARPTDLTMPAADGARDHYVLTRRMKPSLLRPLRNRVVSRPKQDFSVKEPTFAGPPRRRKVQQQLSRGAGAGAGRPSKSRGRNRSRQKARGSSRGSRRGRRVVEKPSESKGLARGVVKMRGGRYLVRASAVGDTGAIRLEAMEVSGGRHAMTTLTAATLEEALGVRAAAAVDGLRGPGTRAATLQALADGAWSPSLERQRFRCVRRLGRRRVSVAVGLDRGRLQVEAFDICAGAKATTSFPVEDAQWILGAAAGAAGPSRRDAGDLAGYVRWASAGPQTDDSGEEDVTPDVQEAYPMHLLRSLSVSRDATISGCSDAVCLRTSIVVLGTPSAAAAASGSGARSFSFASASAPLGSSAAFCAFSASVPGTPRRHTLFVPLSMFTIDVSPSDIKRAVLAAGSRMLSWPSGEPLQWQM